MLVWTHAGSLRPRWTDIEIERVREMEIERAIDRDIHTLYPLEKKRSAKARPMPLEAPVTRHTLAALIEIIWGVRCCKLTQSYCISILHEKKDTQDGTASFQLNLCSIPPSNTRVLR